MRFHTFSHIFQSGPSTVDNLRPICGSCNSSMGTENMLKFMNRCGFSKSKNWNGFVTPDNSIILHEPIKIININDTESSSYETSESSFEEKSQKSSNKKIPKKEVSDIMENSKSPVLNLATKSNVRRAKIKANKNINRLVKSEK